MILTQTQKVMKCKYNVFRILFVSEVHCHERAVVFQVNFVLLSSLLFYCCCCFS